MYRELHWNSSEFSTQSSKNVKIRAFPKNKLLNELIFDGVSPNFLLGVEFVPVLFTSPIYFTRNIGSAKKNTCARSMWLLGWTYRKSSSHVASPGDLGAIIHEKWEKKIPTEKKNSGLASAVWPRILHWGWFPSLNMMFSCVGNKKFRVRRRLNQKIPANLQIVTIWEKCQDPSQIDSNPCKINANQCKSMDFMNYARHGPDAPGTPPDASPDLLRPPPASCESPRVWYRSLQMSRNVTKLSEVCNSKPS